MSKTIEKPEAEAVDSTGLLSLASVWRGKATVLEEKADNQIFGPEWAMSKSRADTYRDAANDLEAKLKDNILIVLWFCQV